MESAPSILLIDDGELGRVRHVLERLGVSFEHRTGPQAEEGVPRPLHLLVSSARRASLMPELEVLDDEPGQPIWVCAHTQDFLPMRQRLKELGFHYLIHSRLDPEVMRLFFLQLLHRGGERRLNVRLPLTCEVKCDFGENLAKGQLEELSREGCRLLADQEVAVGAPAILYLPPELARGDELALSGYVVDCGLEAGRSGGDGFSLVVVFRDLEADAQAQIDSILGGGDLGTRITPLEPLPRSAPNTQAQGQGEASEPQAEEGDASDANRRTYSRRGYARQLTMLHADASDILLGRDLSMTGIRIERNPKLTVGARVSIALNPAEREEPMILEAEVLREDQQGFGLRFVDIAPEQKLRLERMLEQLPPLESLEGAASDGDRLVVSKLVRPED